MDERLTNLREIPLPEPVSYMPQTIGWYVLLALALFAVVLFVIRLQRKTRRNLYRTEALHILEEIERSERISELPALVKRVALGFAPREKIAGLSGIPWLLFLDSTLRGNRFTEGPGKFLLAISYAPPAEAERKMTPEQRRALLDLVRHWIRRHRARI